MNVLGYVCIHLDLTHGIRDCRRSPGQAGVPERGAPRDE